MHLSPTSLILAALALLLSVAPPSARAGGGTGAAPAFFVMGIDPAGDTRFGALDLRQIQVRRNAGDLEIRFVVEDLPTTSGIPVEQVLHWVFNTTATGRNDWEVHAHVGLEPKFFLYWSCCYVSGGGWGEEYRVHGEIDHARNQITVMVPLELFKVAEGALIDSGTEIWACRLSSLGPCRDRYPGKVGYGSPRHSYEDWMTTPRRYVIP